MRTSTVWSTSALISLASARVILSEPADRIIPSTTDLAALRPRYAQVDPFPDPVSLQLAQESAAAAQAIAQAAINSRIEENISMRQQAHSSLVESANRARASNNEAKSVATSNPAAALSADIAARISRGKSLILAAQSTTSAIVSSTNATPVTTAPFANITPRSSLDDGINPVGPNGVPLDEPYCTVNRATGEITSQDVNGVEVPCGSPNIPESPNIDFSKDSILSNLVFGNSAALAALSSTAAPNATSITTATFASTVTNNKTILTTASPAKKFFARSPQGVIEPNIAIDASIISLASANAVAKASRLSDLIQQRLGTSTATATAAIASNGTIARSNSTGAFSTGFRRV